MVNFRNEYILNEEEQFVKVRVRIGRRARYKPDLRLKYRKPLRRKEERDA